MALGIVKIYLGSPFSANRHCSRSVGSWSVCCGQLSWTLRNRGGGCSVLFNHQSLLSNLFSLAPSPLLFFSISCGRNRLLEVNFIELHNFIIYYHLNTRIKILPLATSQTAHLCHQFNHVSTANSNAMF